MAGCCEKRIIFASIAELVLFQTNLKGAGVGSHCNKPCPLYPLMENPAHTYGQPGDLVRPGEAPFKLRIGTFSAKCS